MRRAGTFLFAALMLSGCVATQKDVLDLSSQANDLKRQVEELKAGINSMQANQADLSVRFKSLHDDLAAFTETMRQSQEGMSQLSSKLDDLSAAVTNKVASIGTSLTAAQAKGMDEEKAVLAKQIQQSGPTELFQVAAVRLAKKSYDLAAKGFEDYSTRFPKGALADMAVYDLGEAYYGLQDWARAGRQYGLYLERYPKSNLIPSARLMYALCLINMKKDPAEARQYLESVIADFPASPEAAAAARHLKKLPAASKKAQAAKP